MGFENFERGYLLPKGCKDLIDVIRLPPESQTFPTSPTTPIPTWRIVLYSLSLMTGVNFLSKPVHAIVGWLCVVFAGAFIAFTCLYVNWTQTSRARGWFLTQRSVDLFLLGVMVVVAVLVILTSLI